MILLSVYPDVLFYVDHELAIVKVDPKTNQSLMEKH